MTAVFPSMAARRPGVLRFARGGSLVFEFTGTIGGGALVGWFLDSRLGTDPWLLMGCAVLGAVGGFVRLLRMLRRFEAIDRAAER